MSLRWNSVIVHRPTPKQAAFLLLDSREALFGGAAGGGKSDALLMAALQYVDVPGYAALLVRRRLTDASLPGALMARSHEWLRDAARSSDTDKTWVFESGARLTFGYLEHPLDRYRYQSSEYQFIGFDELTQFSETEYTYLFSRLRRGASSDVPLRMRSASNPGGVGHDWVRHRFLVEGRRHRRWFIPARIEDNPHLDRSAYMESLAALDPLTRAQLLEGDWNAGDDGLLTFDEIVACEADSLWAEGEVPARRCELYVGVDVGRTRDLTVIWTWERVGDVFWCRDLCTLARASFREQKDAITRRLGPGVGRCAIDKGGIGYQLAEELERDYPAVVEGVSLSSGVQGRLAQRLAVAVRERRVRIPRDESLRADWRLVRRLRVVGGVDRVVTERGDVGHADRFWAAALALDAANLHPSFPTATASLPRSFRPKP
jgi:hypothetical protein